MAEKGTGEEGVDLIDVAQNIIGYEAFVNTVMNFQLL
jgi:hypothetical protein